MKKGSLSLRQLIVSIVLIVIAIAIAALAVVSQLVKSDAPVERESAFPLLKGTNLKMENLSVPDDLPGEIKLILVAYDTDQQVFVDKWLKPLEELNEAYPQLAGYYIPLLPTSASNAALPILGGMTLAAGSDRDRERTIVVFTDVDAFNALVDVPDKDEVQLFLLDADNQIRWHGSGSYDHDTLSSLENVLAEVTVE